MEAFAQTMPTLAVAAVYCIWWRAQQFMKMRREKILRERVTFMLWVMANEIA